MAQTRVELNLDFDEYRAATNALTGVAYERLKLAEYDTHKSQEHLEIAEAIAKTRHEIAVQNVGS